MNLEYVLFWRKISAFYHFTEFQMSPIWRKSQNQLQNQVSHMYVQKSFKTWVFTFERSMIEYMLKTTINHKKLVKETYFFFCRSSKEAISRKITKWGRTSCENSKSGKRRIWKCWCQFGLFVQRSTRRKKWKFLATNELTRKSFWTKTSAKDSKGKKRKIVVFSWILREKIWNRFQQIFPFEKPFFREKNYKGTMLQKLSKCEAKAWLCWMLMILPLFRFYVKSNFDEFKRSKNVIFGNFRNCELWILVNFLLESCSNLLKVKFRTFIIAKNDIFGPLEFAKIWFHVESEWR